MSHEYDGLSQQSETHQLHTGLVTVFGLPPQPQLYRERTVARL